MKSLQLRLGVIGAMAALSLAPLCKADTWDRKTTVTINAPVEVPGQVLQPGTYVFKLLNSSSNRHIMEIMNQDENHLFAMTFTVPALRMQTTNRTLLTFYESRGDSPQAVRAIFYPSDAPNQADGQEFLYRNDKDHLRTASYTTPANSNTNVEQSTSAPTPTPEPVKESSIITLPASEVPKPIENPQAETPEEPTLLAQAQTPPPAPAATPAPTSDQPSTTTTPASDQPSPDTLPKTASDLPLIALSGLSAIALALGLRRWQHALNR